jgi:hypothetical protein
MTMFNWWSIAANAIWIGALAVLLAALSLAYQRRQEKGGKFGQLLKEPFYYRVVQGGLAVFCLGMGLTVDLPWWERVLWGMLLLAFSYQLYLHIKNPQR